MAGIAFLNCDIGERDDASAVAEESALLELVDSVNIACGGHAGDERSMQRVVREAIRRGVSIGAHPSYPDRANFGRVTVAMAGRELERCVREQVAALARVCGALGATISHVKPHGALYHDCSALDGVALAVARGAGAIVPGAALVGQAHTLALEHWRRAGHRTLAEGFADRRYASVSELRSRVQEGAVLDDAARAAAQALALARGEEIETDLGRVRIGPVDTICIHSDTPRCAEVAALVRRLLRTR